MSEGFLKRVYDIDDKRDYYDRWAASYDAELAASGYATPPRCAAALACFADDTSAPALDFACGTGLGGAALAINGFTTIDGVDLSPGMLAEARKRGIYRHLIEGKTDGLPDLPDTYAAALACGAIGAGAAPAAYIGALTGKLAPGGLLCFSYNDKTLASQDFLDAPEAEVTAGRLEKLFEEHGPHLPALEMGATVYVYRRL